MSGDALDPSLDRIVTAARDRRERRGAAGDARFSVPELSAEEALALDGLLAPHRPILSGSSLRVSLSVFEAALREQRLDPSREYERVGGRPVRDLPAERAAVRRRKDEFVAWLGEHEVGRARPALAAWLTESARQGRLSAENQDLVARALRVLAVLPAEVQVQRGVLAAELLHGDPMRLMSARRCIRWRPHCSRSSPGSTRTAPASVPCGQPRMFRSTRCHRRSPH